MSCTSLATTLPEGHQSELGPAFLMPIADASSRQALTGRPVLPRAGDSGKLMLLRISHMPSDIWVPENSRLERLLAQSLRLQHRNAALRRTMLEEKRKREERESSVRSFQESELGGEAGPGILANQRAL